MCNMHAHFGTVVIYVNWKCFHYNEMCAISSLAWTASMQICASIFLKKYYFLIISAQKKYQRRYEMKWLMLFLAANCTFILAKKSNHHHTFRQQNQHANISKLLDKLLENYVCKCYKKICRTNVAY